MKLLYIWIEAFRGILHQGIVVDDEYMISVKDPKDVKFSNYTEDGQIELPSTYPPNCGLKIYQRNVIWTFNPLYSSAADKDPVRSISILAGKNAVGKSNILKCLCEQERGGFFSDGRAYFLVFLDEKAQCLEIRSKNIHITGENVFAQKLSPYRGYEKYIIPLTGFVPDTPCDSEDNTRWFFLSSEKGVESYTGYEMMGIYTVMAGLDSYDNQNAFLGAFDFFCRFPKLKDQHNKLVFFLTEHNNNQHLDYFTRPEYSCEEYKVFFVYKLAEILFSNLRKFLYHKPLKFMCSGRRIKEPDEDILKQEDKQLMELIGFVSLMCPEGGPGEKILLRNNVVPETKISSVLNFLESNLSASKSSRYREYVASVRHLFETLYSADCSLFTAFYKLEIPLEDCCRPIVAALQMCFQFNQPNTDWMHGADIRFEWLSSGEFRLAMLFSAIYQQANAREDHPEEKDILWLIDEPEMHMHPDLSRSFIDELNEAVYQFKAAGLLRSCQLILATHSPFIIQNSQGKGETKDKTFLTLVEKRENHTVIKDFMGLPELRFPSEKDLSLSLILYKIFDIPTVELHNMLYGRIQNVAKLSNKKYAHITDFDKWLFEHCGIPQNMKWKPDKDSKNKNTLNANTQIVDVTLETYIRNSIDHPDNILNVPYTESEFRKSIDEMIELLKRVTRTSTASTKASKESAK